MTGTRSTYIFGVLWTILQVSGSQGNPLVRLPCTDHSVKCGEPQFNPIVHKVVGGSEAIPGSWPWTVMLEELGRQVCGGAIISDRFIMTASHCVVGRSINPTRWRVSAGKHRTDRTNPGAVTVKVKQIWMHEDYNDTTTLNDIALMVLEHPLNYSKLIKPVCLPPPDQGVTSEETCVLAGWGDTYKTSSTTVLNQVTLPVLAQTSCAKLDWYGEDFFPNTTFCAGYEEGRKDGCFGDSGGPLVCKVGDHWFAQGIVSWGNDCALYHSPTVYTDVSKFIGWIKNKMLKYGPCDVNGQTIIG